MTAAGMNPNLSERTQLLLLALRSVSARSLAAATLAHEHPADAGVPLAQLLDDRQEPMRAIAAALLGSFGVVDRSIYDRLARAGREDYSPLVRFNAAEALQRLQVAPAVIEESVPCDIA